MVEGAVRVQHGGYPMFRELAPRIEASIPAGEVPVLTRANLHGARPDAYWFYNTEQLHLGFRRSPEYMSLMDGAERVFDYSERNLEWYPRGEFAPLRLTEPFREPGSGGAGGVLFVGLVTERRRQLLEGLGARTLTGIYGQERDDALRAAAVVLSVHAYDDRCNDAARVFPALEIGARVVAERCSERWYNDLVSRHAAMADFAGLADACRGPLS